LRQQCSRFVAGVVLVVTVGHEKWMVRRGARSGKSSNIENRIPKRRPIRACQRISEALKASGVG
jgi:hypothetical protein